MQTFISEKIESISTLVKASWLIPEIVIACLRATKSNQPHLLGLPVVAPYSVPKSLNVSPVSSNISVGKGPCPTLVV